MHYTVYTLRKDGNKLSEAAVRATAITAAISFGKHPTHHHILRASLHGSNGGVLDWLDNAKVTQLTSTGVLITGIEPFNSGRIHKQTWWCEFAGVLPIWK